MNQHLPVIATDAVGAAAGGLVRHERNGLVVRAGDHDALAAALRTLHDDPELRARLGANAARDVARLHPRRLGRRLRRRPARCDRPGDALLASKRQPGREIATAPARCHRAMRRLLTALMILCLAVPATAGAEGGVNKLLRDACGDEHIDGTYTQAEYKKALDALPTDSDEYTGCREVLQRGRLAALGAGKHQTPTTAAAASSTAGAAGPSGGSGSARPRILGLVERRAGPQRRSAGQRHAATDARRSRRSASRPSRSTSAASSCSPGPSASASCRARAATCPPRSIALICLLAATALGVGGWWLWSRVLARRFG